VPGALLELHMGFGQQRRAAGDEQPHVAVRSLVKRHRPAGGCRRSARPSSPWPSGRLAITASRSNFGRKIIDPPASKHDVGRHEQPVGVEDRQGVQQDVAAVNRQ
jgi:hypothetical protein